MGSEAQNRRYSRTDNAVCLEWASSGQCHSNACLNCWDVAELKKNLLSHSSTRSPSNWSMQCCERYQHNTTIHTHQVNQVKSANGEILWHIVFPDICIPLWKWVISMGAGLTEDVNFDASVLTVRPDNFDGRRQFWRWSLAVLTEDVSLDGKSELRSEEGQAWCLEPKIPVRW